MNNFGNYVEYDYDPLYRLTTETRKNSGGVQQAKYEFTYDLAGNRKTQSRYSTTGTWSSYHTYDYNNANQLTLEKRYNQSGGTQDKETQYVYNDLGNLIEKNIETSNFSTPDYNDDIWDYTYDAYNRVTSIYRDDNVSHKVGEYKFNMLGNRVQKKTYDEYWQLDDTIKMLYDGYNCVADYNDANNLLRHYITPGLDENVLVYDVDNTEEYFYLHDGLGTVRQIINDTQTIENNYDYEGFGTSISHSENIYNRYRYTGREYDKETESDPDYNGGVGTKDGLYYYRARTYDSTIGSFTSRDPIPAANLYPYCSANPINFTDPQGRIEIDITKCRAITDKEYDQLKKTADNLVEKFAGIKTMRDKMSTAITQYDKYKNKQENKGEEVKDFSDKMSEVSTMFYNKSKEKKISNEDKKKFEEKENDYWIFSCLEYSHLNTALNYINWMISQVENYINELSKFIKDKRNCIVICPDDEMKGADAAVQMNSETNECDKLLLRNKFMKDVGKNDERNYEILIHEMFHAFVGNSMGEFENEMKANAVGELFEIFSSGLEKSLRGKHYLNFRVGEGDDMTGFGLDLIETLSKNYEFEGYDETKIHDGVKEFLDSIDK